MAVRKMRAIPHFGPRAASLMICPAFPHQLRLRPTGEHLPEGTDLILEHALRLPEVAGCVFDPVPINEEA
jgi:hypothetical protein